jgi:hypothetical protein
MHENQRTNRKPKTQWTNETEWNEGNTTNETRQPNWGKRIDNDNRMVLPNTSTKPEWGNKTWMRQQTWHKTEFMITWMIKKQRVYRKPFRYQNPWIPNHADMYCKTDLNNERHKKRICLQPTKKRIWGNKTWMRHENNENGNERVNPIWYCNHLITTQWVLQKTWMRYVKPMIMNRMRPKPIEARKPMDNNDNKPNWGQFGTRHQKKTEWGT